jgi:Type II secretion system (T2SS), protein M
VTARDRTIIVVLLVAAALAGVWFVGLSPKRKEASDLGAKVDVARQQLTEAEQGAAQARKAKESYDRDYATIATLGKAVPKSDAIPSLVYQLQDAAHNAKITFNALKLTDSGAAAAPTAPAQAVAAANGQSSSSSTSSGTSGSTPGSTANGSTPAATSNGSTPTGSTSTGSTSPSTTTPAPATQAATASLPPGAAVGSAGFPTMPFSFVFNGTFFDMERFLNDVQRFVRVNGDNVDVRGRLLSIDGFALNAGPSGFPSVKAHISATAYLMSSDATSSATPSSPAATPTASAGATAMNGGN